MKGTTLVAVVLGLTMTWQPSSALPEGLRVEVRRGHLVIPVDMAWVRGRDKVYFTLKDGRVRIMDGRRLLRRPCVDLSVSRDGSNGLTGIVLHPRFRKNRMLYVYYTNLSPYETRVTRFIVRNNRCRSPRHIIKGMHASSTGRHNVGQLEFVGGKLFVSTGDTDLPARAQSLNSRLGKVLRYNPDGSIPKSNPFSRPGDPSPVWTYGHRNPFGLTVKPGTRRLYSSENGPSCDDELNRIVRGRNYGWGDGYRCGTRGVGPNPKGPLWRWESTVAPTDPWWYEGRLRSLSNALYVGDFNSGHLHRFKFNRKGTRVRRHRVIYDSVDPIFDVSKGYRGWLYFLTPRDMMVIRRRAS